MFPQEIIFTHDSRIILYCCPKKNTETYLFCCNRNKYLATLLQNSHRWNIPINRKWRNFIWSCFCVFYIFFCCIEQKSCFWKLVGFPIKRDRQFWPLEGWVLAVSVHLYYYMSIFYRHILVVFITINLSTKHKFILFFWAWAILKPSWKAVTRAGEAEALLQAFGLSVGSCGLANVLQCGWVSLTDPKGRSGPAKTNFFLQYVSIKVNIFSVLFFNFQIMLSMYRCLFSLAHNGLRVCAVAD